MFFFFNKHTELNEDFKLNLQQLDEYKQENIALKTQNNQLEKDNTALMESLKELNTNLKSGYASSKSFSTIQMSEYSALLVLVRMGEILAEML